jgi:hypothetical protein
MRFVRAVAAAFLVVSACAQTVAGSGFEDSPHLAPIPAPPPCDVVITPQNASTTLTQHNDPDKRVFCVRPGDYRFIGKRDLRESGTPGARRYLRYDGTNAALPAIHRSQQAIFESIRIFGNWWVVQGLTIRPSDPATSYFLPVWAGDDNVIDGNLLDGRDHPNGSIQIGVLIRGFDGDPALRNSVQRNVIRNGDQSHQAIDYGGVNVMFGWEPGENNNWNKVLDNEIYDWGDGVAVSGISEVCDEPGQQHGTIIDGNDVYITGAKRVDCQTGAADWNGDCACAENGIDVKAHPAPHLANWTRVTNNRVWGYRPTTEALVCGGSGANGQAILGGNTCPRHVFVANNIAADSTVGISAAGSDWIVAGNLIHDVRTSNGHVYGSIALFPAPTATRLSVQFNTIVGVDTAYEDASANTDTRCNVVVESPGLRGIGWPRGANHVTPYNATYAASEPNISGSPHATYPAVTQSRNVEFCYWRKRWTAPERVCVPAAATTAASPHRMNAAQCDEGIGASFGVPVVTYHKPTTSGCGLGAEVLGALAVVRGLRRRLSPI